MKKIIIFVHAIGFLLGINFSLTCQNHIYLDDDLKVASEPMPSKRKGLSSIGKYEFGTYKIISGKTGWTSTKGKTGFFSGDTKTESKTKSSFRFTGRDMDTITANITSTLVSQIDEQYGFVFRTLTGWSKLELIQNYEVYSANYSFSSDSGQWNLVLAYPVGDEIDGEIQQAMISLFKGVLSNSQFEIDIKPEFRWENGRYGTLLKPVEGYIFSMNGKGVAAVQVYPINKMVAWIRQDLPDDLKFIVAAGLATMMVRSEQ